MHKTRQNEVVVVHHDHANDIWFRDVKSRDNAGVISTSDEVRQQPYKEFLSCVKMRDYPDNWDQLRAAILERDNHRCQGCGVSNTELHVHHIVPLGAGGTNVKSNLQVLCEDCHGRIHGGTT